jgi:molybdate transport system permease protein
LLASIWEAATDPGAVFPMVLTLKVMVVAVPVFFLVGAPLGYLLGRGRGRLMAVLDFLISLPLVLPPMAVGFLLLLLLGRRGPLGAPLGQWFDLEVIFSFPGLVLATITAGIPLMVRPVQAAVRGELTRLVELSAVLGKGTLVTFVRVVLPYCSRSVAAGLFLATGRALGEVGVSLLLGGDIVGRTNTISLEIYNSVFTGDFLRAGVLSGLLAVVSLALTWALKRTGRG